MNNDKSIDFVDSFISQNDLKSIISYKKTNPILPTEENEDDFSIVSSSVSDISLNNLTNKENNLGFWNNIRKNLSDLKNKIKFNIIQTDFKIEFEEFEEIQIYHKKFLVEDGEVYAKLMKEIRNEIFWMSYRSDFEPIVYNNAIYTSDAGWGCMIRSGQMIFAKAIYEVAKKLSGLDSEEVNNSFYENTILLFGDNPIKIKNCHKSGFIFFENFLNKNTSSSYSNNNTNKSNKSSEDFEYITKKNSNNLITPPFSLINILNSNINLNKGAGDWFSDHEIIKILRNLNLKYTPINNLNIMHFSEGVVYLEDIIVENFRRKFCDCQNVRISYNYDKANDFVIETIENIQNIQNIENSEIDHENDYVFIENLTQSEVEKECKCFENTIDFCDSHFEMKNPFILFVSMRLGLDKLEDSYYESTLKYFSIENNLGMIGGKGSRALYFIGHADNRIIFIDPHFVQTCVSEKEEDFTGSYRPTNFYALDLERMTPCITIGFYCVNLEDFIKLRNSLKGMSKPGVDIFTVKDLRKNSKIFSKK